MAASAGQLPVCNLLIELGASLDATDDFGQKPIHLAAQSNKSEVVKLFLKQRPSLVSVTTKVSPIVYFDPRISKASVATFRTEAVALTLQQAKVPFLLLKS